MSTGKKIAFIVQRYGLEVNGGAELHCRQLAERLAETNEVEILTTCALDYLTWDTYYPVGESFVNGIKVLRFNNKFGRNLKKEKFYRKLLHRRIRLIKNFQYVHLVMSFFRKWRNGDIWVKMQGPYCKDLISYLENNHHKYDALIFMTYLYYPTVFGLRIAPEKSILIPTAHDEEPIYFPPYVNVFHSPAFIMYNMESEKRFINETFNNTTIPSDIAGVGIQLQEEACRFSFKQHYGIDSDYILYVGRIDINKGVNELFDNFREYHASDKNNLKLVVIGHAFIEIPKNENIIYLGFVSDEVKNCAMQEALLFVLPSHFESLSMVVLESLYFKVPVLVNGKCNVLVEHCKKSDAGFYYNDKKEFVEYINYALDHKDILRQMGEKGKEYVQNNYQWDVILSKFEKAFDLICEQSRPNIS